jgi:hypothetical protein
VRQAAGLEGAGPSGVDFGVLAGLYTAAGALSSGGCNAALLCCYYRTVRAMGGWASLRAWGEREMTVCSRYLAVQVERCVAHNAVCSRHIQTLCK